jgi:hypothetical protein
MAPSARMKLRQPPALMNTGRQDNPGRNTMPQVVRNKRCSSPDLVILIVFSFVVYSLGEVAAACGFHLSYFLRGGSVEVLDTIEGAPGDSTCLDKC